MVRRQRRRQVGVMLEDERGREEALAERLEEVVAEADGPRLDEEILGRLDPEDATFVREVLEPAPPFEDEESDPGDDAWADEEIARLQDEIAESRRRQLAFERYLSALDASTH
jgi:hypothetical protein